jgi:hypothetical protein
MDFKSLDRLDIINYYGEEANTPTATIQPLHVSISISLPSAAFHQSYDELASQSKPS